MAQGEARCLLCETPLGARGTLTAGCCGGRFHEKCVADHCGRQGARAPGEVRITPCRDIHGHVSESHAVRLSHTHRSSLTHAISRPSQPQEPCPSCGEQLRKLVSEDPARPSTSSPRRIRYGRQEYHLFVPDHPPAPLATRTLCALLFDIDPARVKLLAKGRALERLRAYDLAAQHYRESARLSPELREVALESADVCERIASAVRIGIDLVDPLADYGVEPLPLDGERVRLELDERVARLTGILDDVRDNHYRWIVQEEIERADEIRAEYSVAIRTVQADGTVLALQELQRVVTRHGASKRRLRHLLRLGEFYETLSREYLQAVPPESLEFDPAKFKELVDAAIQLYELVASHDGRPEKLEASRNLEAFLALTLKVDADRFDR